MLKQSGTSLGTSREKREGIGRRRGERCRSPALMRRRKRKRRRGSNTVAVSKTVAVPLLPLFLAMMTKLVNKRRCCGVEGGCSEARAVIKSSIA